MLPPGPHMEHLRKGDIVFNARQTQQLLSFGKTGTYAKSYASGTLTHPVRAFDGGFHGNGFDPWEFISASNSAKNSTSNSKKSKKDTTDWIVIAIDRITRLIKKLTSTMDSAFKSMATKTDAFYNSLKRVTEGIDLQEKAAKRYREEAEKVKLSEALKELVRNGAIDISKYDEKTRKLIEEYKKLYEQSLDAEEAAEELRNKLSELYKSNFDMVKKDAENQIEMIEHMSNTYDNQIDIITERGYKLNKSIYQSMIAVEQQRAASLQKELIDLQEAFALAMESGTIEDGSDAYYEMLAAINSVKEEIDETTLSILKLSNSIRDIGWEYFDYMQDRIENVTSEVDFLIDLLSNSNLTEDGVLSDKGEAVLGLRAQKYNLYMSQADDYAKELANINKELENDPYNTKLIERRDELLELQRKSILAAEKEKNAIIDLTKEGIQAEIDALQELITKYKESLKTAKSLNDYNKKISDQTTAADAIRKQIMAYAGDLSEETVAKVQKLQIDLKEAEEQIRETEYEKYIEDQEKLLDDLYDEYEEILNQRLDDTNKLIQDVLDSVNEKSESIATTIETEADKVGYTISGALLGAWNGGLTVVSSYDKEFSDKWTATNNLLYGISSFVELMYKNSIEQSSALSNSLSGTSFDPSSLPGVNFTGIKDRFASASGMSSVNSGVNSINFENVNITIPIDHVDDYDDFVMQLRNDGQFEKFIRAITVDKLAGSSPLSKYNYKW